MKWTVNMCVDTSGSMDLDSTLTYITQILSGLDGIQECQLVSKEQLLGNDYLIEFCAVANEMILPLKVIETLRRHFIVSEVNITRESWSRKNNIPFQWVNDGVTVYKDGSVYHQDHWDLFINNVAVFTVVYVPTYTRGWARWRREKVFGNAQYAWTGVTGGVTPLYSDTIDDALSEFESLYITMAQSSIEDTEKKLHDLKKELEDFCKWKEN